MESVPRGGRAALALILAASVAACGEDAGDGGAGGVTYGAPEDAGPFAVGVTTLEVESGGRLVPVEVWYPADAVSGPVEAYTLRIGGLEIASAPSPAATVRDAPLDGRDGPYPVVVFSHGNGGLRIQSFYLTEHLASHGFVVAAPDHVGNTLQDRYLGTVLPGGEVAVLRPTDVSRALDAVLEASERADHVLAGAADPDRVGVAGHSFGGYTAFRIAGATLDPEAVAAACEGGELGLFCDGWDAQAVPVSQRDPRFDVALPQAPGGAQALAAGGGFADTAVPVFIQHGDADLTTPLAQEGRVPFEALPSPAWLLVLEGVGHYTFSDMCRLVEVVNEAYRDLTEGAVEDGCGEDNLAWREAHRLANAHAAAFLHAELAGRAGYEAWLTPPAETPAGVAAYERK